MAVRRCARLAREFHRTFIETEFNLEHGALLASKVLWDLPVENNTHWNRSWPYTAFLSASITPAGFDADKRDFLGRNGNLRQPQTVMSGQSRNHAGRWGDPSAASNSKSPLRQGKGARLSLRSCRQ